MKVICYDFDHSLILAKRFFGSHNIHITNLSTVPFVGDYTAPDYEKVFTNASTIYETLRNDASDIAILPENLCPYPIPGDLILVALSSATPGINDNIVLISKRQRADLQSLFSAIDIRKNFGKVTLVGFGPGDPELLTIKGEKAIGKADVIFFDDLLEKNFLDNYNGKKVYVGKRKGSHHKEQIEINNLMLEAAKSGKQVVRLKGGDPMIFAHGGEEVEFLESNFVETTVIPGISTSNAVASLLKTPLTHRDVSSSVAFLSGHSPVGMQVPDAETLVYYMAGSKVQELAQLIIAKGWNESTPVLLAHNVSLPNHQEFYHTLAQLAAGKIVFPTPVIIMVGNVVNLRNTPALELAKQRVMKRVKSLYYSK